MEKELVSIIMPSYNAERFISDSIYGILSQSFQYWELLISDDCSTDKTIEIVEKFANQDNRIKLLKASKNGGAAVARNSAIAIAKGRFLAFCDSDDVWDSKKLEVQIEFMLNNPCVISYHNYRVINTDNQVVGHRKSIKQIDYKKLLEKNYIGCLTAMVDTNISGKVAIPLLRKRQDWSYWLTLLRPRGAIALSIDKELASYRVGHNSLSSSKLKLIKHTYNVYKKSENFSLLRSIFYTFRFLIIQIIDNKINRS